MAQLDELIAEAELGEEARGFLDSNLGKYLKGVAEQEIQISLEKLGDVDPENTIAIRNLQNEAAKWRLLIELLDGLVQKGEQAIQIYKQQTE